MLYCLSLWCILTYNIHHSRSIATDPKSFLIGWTCVGTSILSAQNSTTSGNSSIAILITTSTWYKATRSTCWSPVVPYSTSSTHSSACQGDRWCCPVVWWLIAWLRRSVTDVNHNLESWRKNVQVLCVSEIYLAQKCSIFHTPCNASSTFCVCILWSDM